MTRFRFIAVLLLMASVVPESQGQLLRRFGRTSGATSQRTNSNGRYCNNANCQMCNRLFGLMPGYAYVNGRVTYVGNRPSKPADAPPKIPAIDSTPQQVVEIMLAMCGLTPADTLLDPGCGDARFLTTAAQRYGCECIGIEVDPATADKAEAAVQATGVADRVLIIRGDARKIRIDRVTVVVLYLFPADIEAMRSNWQNARMMVSYLHEIPGVENRSLTLFLEGQEHKIFFWVKE